MPVIVGVVPNPSDAESAINNLTEQGVSQRSISLVTADETDARAVIDDGGPLKGTTVATLQARLQKAGMTPEETATYTTGMQSGGALLAVHVGSDEVDSVMQSLHDAGASRTDVLP